MSWFRRTPQSSSQPISESPADTAAADAAPADVSPVAAADATPADTAAAEAAPADVAPVAPATPAAAAPAAAAPAAAAPAEAPFVSTMMDYQLTVQHLYDRAARLFPRREIVTVTADGFERTTFGEVCMQAKRLAAALEQLGVRKSDRVATLAWNTARHYELYLAVPCMGAVLHTLNLRLPADQLCYIIRDAGDKVIFVDADLFPLLEKNATELSPSVEHIVVMNGTATPTEGTKLPPVSQYEDLIASAPEGYQWPTLDERDACAMCYTSGTTGNPKGVVYSHRSTFLHAMSVTMADTLALSERDVLMPLVPMFHVNAWGLPHAAALVGSKLVFPGRFMDPTRVAQTMAGERVTTAAGVPTIWLGLLQLLDKGLALDLSSVNRLVCGGSAAPAALIEGLDRHGLPILHAWGMTETSPIGSVARLKSTLADAPHEQQIQYRAKQGIPVTGVELRIVDLDSGVEAPWDGVTFGEIQVRGPWITGSYYKGSNDEAGVSKFADGWFRTGDVATIDDEGYLQIVDRTKDVVKSGGEWISSVLLEGMIMGHPQVLEAAVVGMPHPKWQERPVAVVVPKAGEEGKLTADDIRAYLEPRVAKWWLPDEVIFAPSIPKTSVGKFDKKVMRVQLADQVHLGE